MPAREIRIASFNAGILGSLTKHGMAALHEADLVVYDDALIVDLYELAIKGEVMRVSTSPIVMMDEIVDDLRLMTEALQRGQRVLRLVSDTPKSLRRLEHELRLLRNGRHRVHFIPHIQVFEREANRLKLPWLTDLHQSPFRLLQSHELGKTPAFWRELAVTDDTIAVTLGQGTLHKLVEELLAAGSDPQRPVALVAHDPTKDPICWLTTLNELDELYLHWKNAGATILYIGSWPRAVLSSRHQPDFWGPLAHAAQHWLRTGALAKNG